jgi:hypothetical protein
MGLVRWTGIGFELLGKTLQQQAVEDWIKDVASRAIESLGATGQTTPADVAALRALTGPEPDTVKAVVAQIRSMAFRVALEEAVAEAPGVLGSLFGATSLYDEATVTPIFALHAALVRHFDERLGRSALAQRDPRVAKLVQQGLAADHIETIRTQLDGEQDGTVPLMIFSSSVKTICLVAQDADFEWPGQSCHGFVLGYVLLNSHLPDGKALALPAEFKAQARPLLRRLGEMSAEELDTMAKEWEAYREGSGGARFGQDRTRRLGVLRLK